MSDPRDGSLSFESTGLAILISGGAMFLPRFEQPHSSQAEAAVLLRCVLCSLSVLLTAVLPSCAIDGATSPALESQSSFSDGAATHPDDAPFADADAETAAALFDAGKVDVGRAVSDRDARVDLSDARSPASDSSTSVLLPADAAAAHDSGAQRAYVWRRLPTHFPRPQVPADNPMTEAKVELGRHLFYDVRLSKGGTFACATCHEQRLAFSDQGATAVGATGVHHPRSSMSLANVAYSQTLTWGNSLLVLLERQALVPTFGDAPVELGNTSIPEVEARLRGIPRYAAMFAAAFPGEAPAVTLQNLNRALAAFQRTIISGDSPYDRYVTEGDRNALTAAAERGRLLVTTDADSRFKCSRCHGGFNLTDHVTWEGRAYEPPVYHQTGLYDVDGHGAYPAPNTGVFDVTQLEADMGKFKAPTLRNVALTAPYMHDGSLATLADVLDHYAQGGRARNTERTDPLLQPFAISTQEKADVIAFLASLTDETLLHDTRLSDPWRADAGL